MRLDGDASKISQHAGLDVTGYFEGLDVHGGGPDADSRVDLLVHGLVRANIVSHFEPQILLGARWIHAEVVGAVLQYLLEILLQYDRIVADALDEKDATTELPGKIVEDLGALRSCHQRGVQDLQTGKLLKLIARIRYSRGVRISGTIRLLSGSLRIHWLYFVNSRFTCSRSLTFLPWDRERFSSDHHPVVARRGDVSRGNRHLIASMPLAELYGL